MKRTTICLLVPCFAFLFFAMAPKADADVVRLRTGVSIKGQPDAMASTTDILIIQDFLTGAKRTFDWSVVNPADKRDLWIKWGWQGKSRKTVEGDRVTRTMSGGGTIDILGEIISKTASHTTVLVGGKEIRLENSQVVRTEKEPMDPRDIRSPEQLYELRLELMKEEKKKNGKDPNEVTSDDHFVLGDYSDWIEMLEKAKEHFGAAAADPSFKRKQIAEQRLARVEALLRDKAALDQLREIRMMIGLKSFRRARTLLASFETEHAEASDAVKRRLEKTQKGFDDARNKYFRRETREKFMKNVISALRTKAKDDKSTYSDTFAYIRRDLAEEVFTKTAEKLNEKDDVTPEQVKAFWDARPKRNWWNASFGGGTFIARPPKLEKQKRSRSTGNRKSGSKGGGGPAMKTPPKPTRDTWWAKAKLKERVQHMLARFAEDSALFELSEREDLSICPVCNGAGMQEKALSNGSMWRYVCTRCAGAKNDVRLKFR